MLGDSTEEVARALSAGEGRQWQRAKSCPVLFVPPSRRDAGAKQGLKASTVTEMCRPSQAPRWPCVLACGGASLRRGPGAALGKGSIPPRCCGCREPEMGDLGSADAVTFGGEKGQEWCGRPLLPCCPSPGDQHGHGAGPVLRPGCQQSPWLGTAAETLLPALGELTAGGTVSTEEKAVGGASDVLGL